MTVRDASKTVKEKKRKKKKGEERNTYQLRKKNAEIKNQRKTKD